MRDLVIVIADLYRPQEAVGLSEVAASPPGTFAGIERVGRFGRRAALREGWRSWLAGSLGCADLAAAAPALIAAAEIAPPAPRGTPWIATPLSLSPGAGRLPLEHRGILRLPREELAALAAAFASTFAAAGFTLVPLSCGEFLLVTPGLAAVPSTEPARCAGGDLAPAMPRGAAAAPLRRLLAEIEMWLHGEAVNAARSRRGELPVTTLWPWGAQGRGLALERREMRERWLAFGCDPWLRGLWHLLGEVCAAVPARLEDALEQARVAGAVLVAEVGAELQDEAHGTVSAALARLDARFVSPALAALRRRELASVTLIANDHRVTLNRRSRLRLWRRAHAGLGGFA